MVFSSGRGFAIFTFFIVFVGSVRAADAPFSAFFGTPATGCPALLEATAEARVVEVYAKLLFEYRKTATEAEYGDWIESALREKKYFTLDSPRSDRAGTAEALEKLGRLREEGKLPNGQAISPVELEGKVRAHLEKELAILRGISVRVEATVAKRTELPALTRVFRGDGKVPSFQSVEVSADFSQALTADRAGFRVWNLTTGETRAFPISYGGTPNFLQVSADFTRAIAHVDGADFVTVLDVGQGRLLHALEGHETNRKILAAAISADGKRALTSSLDYTLRLWDLDTGTEIRVFRKDWDRFVSFRASADFKRAVTLSDHERVELWDLETGRSILSMKCPSGLDEEIHASADFKRAVVANSKGISVFDLERGVLLKKIQRDLFIRFRIQISADAKRAVTVSVGGRAELWDLENGKLLRKVEWKDANPNWTAPFRVDADFTRAILGAGFGETFGWNLRTGKLIPMGEKKHATMLGALHVDSDFDRALSIGVGADEMVLWNLEMLVPKD